MDAREIEVHRGGKDAGREPPKNLAISVSSLVKSSKVAEHQAEQVPNPGILRSGGLRDLRGFPWLVTGLPVLSH